MTDNTAPERALDEEYDTHIEVALNPYGAWQAIQSLAARVAELENLYAETADHMEKGWTYARGVEAERDAARAEDARVSKIALSLCEHMEMVSSDMHQKGAFHQHINVSSLADAAKEARAAMQEGDT